jgi:hypothetical protein
MSKSRHNNKWFDDEDLEWEGVKSFTDKKSLTDKNRKKNRFDEIALRREEKHRSKANTFLTDKDDWD